MALDEMELAETPIAKPDTPIPNESLLPLLQAEFALRQRDFDRGLALLAEQAVLLKDPALARRALRLAEFVNDTDQAAMMAVRLVELDPGDGAAAAAASGWLSRAGRPVDAVYYAKLALSTGIQSTSRLILATMTRWMRAVGQRLPGRSELSPRSGPRMTRQRSQPAW